MSNSRNSAILVATLSILFSAGACAISRPCTEAGNLKGLPQIKGNKQCYQKKNREGVFVNDGKFIQWHPNGQIAIEGEFRDGQKNGIWYFYDDTGKKSAQRVFENDVEMSSVRATDDQEKPATRRSK